MFQAFATLVSAALALLATGMIALMLRADWDRIREVLGSGASRAAPAPLPPHVRADPARRAVMVRVEVPAPRRAAA